MSQATSMTQGRRIHLYTRHLTHKYSDGFARLTPAQGRRVRKHDRRRWGKLAETEPA